MVDKVRPKNSDSKIYLMEKCVPLSHNTPYLINFFLLSLSELHQKIVGRTSQVVPQKFVAFDEVHLPLILPISGGEWHNDANNRQNLFSKAGRCGIMALKDKRAQALFLKSDTILDVAVAT